MTSFIRNAVAALLLLLVSLSTLAQSIPTSLFACLDGNGNLYGVTPTGKLGEGCSAGDLPVSLGSAGTVKASNGLVGNITNGVVDIGVAEGLAIPPSCPAGQIPISDGQGAWICTLPTISANANPAAKVWFAPRYESYSGGAADVAHFVNPGSQHGRVVCYTMTILGGYVPELTEEHAIRPGSRGRCDAWKDRPPYGGFFGDRTVTWLVIVSDVSIVVSLGATRSDKDITDTRTFAVDCRFPEGYEHVCALAIE